MLEQTLSMQTAKSRMQELQKNHLKATTTHKWHEKNGEGNC